MKKRGKSITKTAINRKDGKQTGRTRAIGSRITVEDALLLLEIGEPVLLHRRFVAVNDVFFVEIDAKQLDRIPQGFGPRKVRKSSLIKRKRKRRD